jgi:hypothetical protein
MRQGPGSGVPTCTGTPTPCAGLTETDCIGALGCLSTLGQCSGIARDCYAQFDSYSCDRIQGCYWSSSSSSCSGVPESCDLMAGSGSCGLQPGCSWTPGSCSGTPDSCGTMPPSLCTTQPGCLLSP